MGSKALYTESVLDRETGELIVTKMLKKTALTVEHFVRMYLRDSAKTNCLSHSEYRVLHEMAKVGEFNTNIITLNKGKREQLAISSGVKLNTVYQVISRLAKKNFIIKLDSGNYQMNPLMFFTGEEIERAKYLEVTTRYEICETCK